MVHYPTKSKVYCFSLWIEIAKTVIYVKRRKMEPGGHEEVCLMPLPPMNFWTSCDTTSSTSFPPHCGNQIVCTLHLERNQSVSLACIPHLHRGSKWGFNYWTFVLAQKHMMELGYPRVSPPRPEQSFWTSHHTKFNSQSETFLLLQLAVCLLRSGFLCLPQSMCQVFPWICLPDSNPSRPQINFWLILQPQIFIGRQFHFTKNLKWLIRWCIIQ